MGQMNIETTVSIAASPERVWAVLSDVERWHEWTASITCAKLLTPAPLHNTSAARIKQPRFPSMVWRVTTFEPGRGFAWETRSLGAVTVGEHWISANLQGGVDVLLTVRQTGPLVFLFRAWISKITREYVEMEAQGLKRRCEQV
jgi:uncharacterized protein YndB with AHSA1/START domain